MSQRGLTLIELLVALAISAVLGLLAWRGTSQMLAGDRRLHADLARWQALERSLARLEQDLLQVAAPNAAGQAGLEFCARPAGTTAAAATTTAADSPQRPLNLFTLAAGQGVRRTAWRLAGEQLEWRRWPNGGDPAQAATDLVLDGVRELRWQAFAEGRLYDCWPPPGQPRNRLPAALVVDLKLAGIGPVERWYALR